jgi:hypothetical protein
MPMHPEATYGCDAALITSVIELSSIVIAATVEQLPAGYEQVDGAVLRWIATEARANGLTRH